MAEKSDARHYITKRIPPRGQAQAVQAVLLLPRLAGSGD